MSESTKISKRWLKALEEEHFEVLPGGVFNRGFVRSYARFLGINEEQTVADYVAASNEQEPPPDKFPLEIHEKESDPQLNPKKSILPVVLAFMALIAVVGGWAYWMRHKPLRTDLSEQHAAGPATQQFASRPAQPSSSSLETDAGKPAEPRPSDATDKASSDESEDQNGPISIVIR